MEGLEGQYVWRGHGSSMPLPSYLPLLLSSIWQFLGCTLNNKLVISPYRFQHMESLTGTFTYNRKEQHFICHSYSTQWLQVIICLITGVIQLSRILCGTYSVII